jgi:hypothetical protein
VPLRLLARAAPFVLGAVAAAIWLRRRHAERPALPVRTGAPPPAAEPRRTAADAPPQAADPPSRRAGRASTARFQRAPSGPADRSTGRFVRASEPRPVDIVTVVDDLLGAPR